MTGIKLRQWLGRGQRRPRSEVRRWRVSLQVWPLETRTAPATFTVLNLNDGGANSLRDCVSKANAAAGADTIDFQAGLSGTITLTGGEIAISGALSIQGPGLSALTISGNNAQRIFNVSSAPAATAISFNGLTLTGGFTSGLFASGSAISGGSQSLNLTNCAVTNNISSGFSGTGVGGAIVLTGGLLTADNCLFTGNSATNRGGALAIQSTGSKLTLNQCTVSNNTTSGMGGGIYANDNVSIISCTISSNTASGVGSVGVGGGIVIRGSANPITIRNSTFSGNVADFNGGGIGLFSTSGTLTVQNSTITGNSVVNSSTGSGGGGIASAGYGTSAIALESTIVSGNFSVNGPDILSTGTVQAKTSAIGSGAGFALTDLSGNLAYGTNLKLGPLQNNGGPTLTHQPAFDSPLVDVGSNPAALTTDQRGTGFPRAFVLTSIGAVEEPVNLFVMNGNDTGYGSLRQTILHANSGPGPDTITFDSSFFSIPRTILLNSTISILEGMTISAPPALVTINAQAKSRILSINPVVTGDSVSISGLVLTNGKTAPGGGDGAGINNNDAHLSLYRVTVSNCFATNDPGGGINSGGTLVVTDCEIVGNRTKFDGGGINAGTLIMLNSTVRDNVADRAGGGIRAGNCTITNSTISDNDVSSGGDGGGGIAFFGSGVIKNSTVANNLSDGFFGGGGIWRSSGTGSLTLDSTIVAGNGAKTGHDILFDSPTNVAGNNNLIGIANNGNFTLTGTGNLTGTNVAPLSAKLGALANNGGLTPTRPLLTGSPALNKGFNPVSLTTDQRGAGFARDVNGVDIGAFEAQGAKTFVVINTADSGVGSLRQAIADANDNAGWDTVTFDAAVFASLQLIKLSTGTLTLGDDMTIAGPAAKVIIDGNNTGRVFSASSSATNHTYILQNLNITNSKAGAFGCGIYVSSGHLTIQNCTLSNLTATASTGAQGAAIHINNSTSVLTIEDSAIFGNSTIHDGGAIYARQSSSVVIRRSNISSNTAARFGGGIVFGGTLTCEDSAITGNAVSGTQPTYGGGAIFADTISKGLLVKNTTISGNSTNQSGGGVLISGSGIVAFQNCTITGNTSALGGGIAQPASGTSNVTLDSTIVAGNSGSGPDLNFASAAIVGGSNNLVGITDEGSFTLSGIGNLTGTKAAPLNAKLGPLVNNGGPTPTHALLSGSPAINQGSNPATLINDQRGTGFPRVSGSAIDIGAFETQPTTFVVTNADNSGVGSLRQALLNANANGGPDTITFDPAFFNVPRIIALSTGQLDNTDEVSITGPGAELCTVSGGNVSRILDTQQAHGNLPVSISGLTFAFGQLFGVDDGSAIFAQDQKLTLSKCVFSSNVATRRGGAISMVNGSLTATDCTFTNNLATNNGGAISASTSDVTLRRCTISGNTAGNNGGGAYFYNVANLLIEDCTFSSNQATSAAGGAVLNVRQSGTSQMIIRNSTISGNSAGSEGGGLAISSGVNLVVQNSTLTANSTSGVGGGIFGSVVIASSILFGNQASVSAPEIAATTVTVSTSLIGSKSGVSTFNADSFTNSHLGVNPLLSPLANNGGPTLTHSLLAGSPALNNGSNPAGLTNDQRGSGFSRSVGQTDIGAFELQIAPAKVTSVQVNDGSAQRSRVTSLLVTFDVPPQPAGNLADGFQLKRQLDNAVVALAAAPSGNNVTLTFTGGPVEFTSLADGRYTLTVLASQIVNLDGNGDGSIGDDFLLVGDPATAPKLYRLYGDADGNGIVNQADFIAFRNAFNNGPSSIFDFEGDGNVTQSDFILFRNRFNLTP